MGLRRVLLRGSVDSSEVYCVQILSTPAYYPGQRRKFRISNLFYGQEYSLSIWYRLDRRICLNSHFVPLLTNQTMGKSHIPDVDWTTSRHHFVVSPANRGEYGDAGNVEILI